MPVRDADRDGEVVFVVAVVVVDVEYRKDLDARTYSYSAPHVNVARLMAPPPLGVRDPPDRKVQMGDFE